MFRILSSLADALRAVSTAIFAAQLVRAFEIEVVFDLALSSRPYASG
jgi:hypothetical protein